MQTRGLCSSTSAIFLYKILPIRFQSTRSFPLQRASNANLSGSPISLFLIAIPNLSWSSSAPSGRPSGVERADGFGVPGVELFAELDAEGHATSASTAECHDPASDPSAVCSRPKRSHPPLVRSSTNRTQVVLAQSTPNRAPTATCPLPCLQWADGRAKPSEQTCTGEIAAMLAWILSLYLGICACVCACAHVRVRVCPLVCLSVCLCVSVCL